MIKLTGSIRGLDMSKFVISIDQTFSGTLNLSGQAHTTMDNEQSGVVNRQPVAGTAPSFAPAPTNKTPLLAQQPEQYAAGPYGPYPGGVPGYGGMPVGYPGNYGQQQPIGQQPMGEQPMGQQPQVYYDPAPPKY